MENVSLNKEALKLDLNREYILIDVLYLNNIKREVGVLDKNNLLTEIRERIFPYTRAAFAEYIAKTEVFTINQIKSVKNNEVVRGDRSFFSTDTGLIILIQKEHLLDFLSVFEYDLLVDSIIDVIDKDYWASLVSNYKTGQIGLILAPGVDSGFDFTGSGIYQIQ